MWNSNLQKNVSIEHQLSPVLYTNIIRFLTYYVHARKCPSDKKYNQNPNQTMLNNILRPKRTHDVIVTKCLPHTKYKQKLNLKAINKALGLKETPIWHLVMLIQGSLNLIIQRRVLDMYKMMIDQNMSCRIKVVNFLGNMSLSAFI